MITSARRSALSPPVIRHFEFTRIQDQLIALAYQALIPAVSRHLEQPRPGRGNPPADHDPGSPIEDRGSLTSHAQ